MRAFVVALVLLLAIDARASCESIYSSLCGIQHDALADASVISFDLDDDDYVSVARFRIEHILSGTTTFAPNDEIDGIDTIWFVSPLYTEVGSHYLVWIDETGVTWGRLLDDGGRPRFPEVDLPLEDVATAASVMPFDSCVAAFQDLGLQEPPCNDVGNGDEGDPEEPSSEHSSDAGDSAASSPGSGCAAVSLSDSPLALLLCVLLRRRGRCAPAGIAAH